MIFGIPYNLRSGRLGTPGLAQVGVPTNLKTANENSIF